MKGDYPRFKATYTHEELVEHFLLSPAERALVDTCHGDANRHGVAVLLKAVQYLGYFPTISSRCRRSSGPSSRTSSSSCGITPQYPWHSRTPRSPCGLDSALIQASAFPPPRIRRPWKPGSGHRGLGRRRRKKSLRECAYGRLRALGH